MVWRIEIDQDARNTLKKLDKPIASQIARKLREIGGLDDPTDMGKPLTATRKGYWVYRVGDYPLICAIQYGRLVVLVVEFSTAARTTGNGGRLSG